MVKRPAVLFADEPTGALDHQTANQVVDILEQVNQKGTTIIMVTHDREISERAKRRIRIEDGKMMDSQRSGL
jgi:putative ABC transport system ATP-binding protein